MRADSRIGYYVIALVALMIASALLAACGDEDDLADDPPASTVETPQPPAGQPEDEPEGEPTPTPTAESDDMASAEPDDTTALSRLQNLDIELELFAEGFIQPTDMVAATDGTDRIFVVSRVGTIHVIESGELREELFLDLREQIEHHMVEQGMLSMTLHPNFAENGYFYVNYINYKAEDTIVSRFEMSEDGQRGDPESEVVILEIEQPHYSHNGGNLKFGPDGYLYIGVGDGEDPGDVHENAQNPGTLLGAILRIDVDNGDPYAIPVDNPFVDDPDALDEVWAIGLRNPWRFSFDPVTGDMYLVDVGQWAVEEVNVQPADSSGGENYGWPIVEGDECWEADECDQEGLTMPTVTYENPTQGCAVIGGYPYYGSAYPDMEGIYFFGDWCSGRIWGMVEDNGEWVKEELIHSDLMINAFGLDHDGEIYALDFDEGGGIYRIVPKEPIS